MTYFKRIKSMKKEGSYLQEGNFTSVKQVWKVKCSLHFSECVWSEVDTAHDRKVDHVHADFLSSWHFGVSCFSFLAYLCIHMPVWMLLVFQQILTSQLSDGTTNLFILSLCACVWDHHAVTCPCCSWQCKLSCRFDSDCVAIEYVLSRSACYVHTNASRNELLVPHSLTDYYDLKRCETPKECKNQFTKHLVLSDECTQTCNCPPHI